MSAGWIGAESLVQCAHMRVVLWGVLMGLSVFVSSSVGWAQCTMDTDCKGERICEQGKCTNPVPSASPTPALAPAQPPAEPATEAPSPPPAADAPLAPAPALSDPEPRFFEDEAPRKPKKRIGRPGLMATGIVLTALGPMVFVVGALSSQCGGDGSSGGCDEARQRLVGVALVSLALIGVGIPLIVVGAKRVPVRQVTVGPWLAPRQAGLQLHVAL
jgi:hypothetical protein